MRTFYSAQQWNTNRGNWHNCSARPQLFQVGQFWSITEQTVWNTQLTTMQCILTSLQCEPIIVMLGGPIVKVRCGNGSRERGYMDTSTDRQQNWSVWTLRGLVIRMFFCGAGSAGGTRQVMIPETALAKQPVFKQFWKLLCKLRMIWYVWMEHQS